MIKRVFATGILLFTGFLLTIIGQIQEHQWLLITGIVLGGIVGLAIVIWVIKKSLRFLAHSLTSVIFITISLVVVGLLSWNGQINAFVGYSIGVGLGSMLLILLLRKLGGWAQTSIIFGEIFAFATAYKIRSYLVKDTIIDKDTKVIYNMDYKNLVLVLNEQMGYTTRESKEAARYAIENTGAQISLEDKIREALSYLSGDRVLYQAENN